MYCVLEISSFVAAVVFFRGAVVLGVGSDRVAGVGLGVSLGTLDQLTISQPTAQTTTHETGDSESLALHPAFP